MRLTSIIIADTIKLKKTYKSYYYITFPFCICISSGVSDNSVATN